MNRIESFGQVLDFPSLAAGRGRPDQGADLVNEHTADRALRERARAVIPSGMYRHQSRF